MMKLQRLKLRTVRHFCDSVQAKGSLRKCRTVKIDRKSIVSPSLSKAKCEVANSIVALNVSLPYITWSHLDRNMELYSWERKPLYTVSPKNNLQSCYSVAKYALEILPDADLYVAEQKVSRPKHLSHVPLLLIQASIESMLFCMLNREQEPNFYSMKDMTVASLFNLQVGNERASGQHVVEKILKNSSDYPTVCVADTLQETYRKESRVNKEYMCNVLLLSVAFYDCIFSVNS